MSSPSGPDTGHPPSGPKDGFADVCHRLAATYHWLRAHRVGRWALAAVWAGLMPLTLGASGLIPIWLERDELYAALWADDP